MYTSGWVTKLACAPPVQSPKPNTTTGRSKSRTKRVMRSFTAAMENNAPAPSMVCIPPEEMKHTTGRRRSAQSTKSLQNFSALAMSNAPALKAVLEITAPTVTPSAPFLKRPMPVTTPHGVVPFCKALSMATRKPGKRCGSELTRSPPCSLKSSKNSAMKTPGVSALARFC